MRARAGIAVRLVAAVAVVSLAAVGVAACGGTSRDGTSGGGEKKSSTAGGQPKYGGTLVVASTSDPGLLNPAITSSGAAHPVTGQIFDGLVILYGKDFTPRPALARKWDISPDGLTYTFSLRRGVRWHDGKPFSSADVKFTYEKVLLELNPRTRQLKPIIKAIETPDKDTVVFRLNFPYPPFLKWLDEDNGAILPKHLYQGGDPLKNPANSKPVGTGPFQFKSAVKGNRITLARNPRYFEKGKPYLDRIVFRVIAPPQALQGFKAGEVGLLPFINGPVLKAVSNDPDATVTRNGRIGFAQVVRMIPNTKRKPFDDVRVRQAIAYAIDRDFIARSAFPGELEAATGPISSAFTPWYSDDVMKFPPDPAKAKALLDQAGLKPGKGGVRFRASFIFDKPLQPAAQLLKQQLGKVGIALDLKLLDFNAWVNKLYIQKDFDLGYSRLTGPADPDIGVKRAFTCDNIAPVPFSNGESYCNKDLDALFARAARETDTQKRVALYGDIQRIIVKDQPQFFLVGGVGPWAWSNKYQGIDQAGSKSPYYFGRTAYSTSGSASPPS